MWTPTKLGFKYDRGRQLIAPIRTRPVDRQFWNTTNNPASTKFVRNFLGRAVTAPPRPNVEFSKDIIKAAFPLGKSPSEVEESMWTVKPREDVWKMVTGIIDTAKVPLYDLTKNTHVKPLTPLCSSGAYFEADRTGHLYLNAEQVTAPKIKSGRKLTYQEIMTANVRCFASSNVRILSVPWSQKALASGNIMKFVKDNPDCLKDSETNLVDVGCLIQLSPNNWVTAVEGGLLRSSEAGWTTGYRMVTTDHTLRGWLWWLTDWDAKQPDVYTTASFGAGKHKWSLFDVVNNYFGEQVNVFRNSVFPLLLEAQDEGVKPEEFWNWVSRRSYPTWKWRRGLSLAVDSPSRLFAYVSAYVDPPKYPELLPSYKEILNVTPLGDNETLDEDRQALEVLTPKSAPEGDRPGLYTMLESNTVPLPFFYPESVVQTWGTPTDPGGLAPGVQDALIAVRKVVTTVDVATIKAEFASRVAMVAKWAVEDLNQLNTKYTADDVVTRMIGFPATAEYGLSAVLSRFVDKDFFAKAQAALEPIAAKYKWSPNEARSVLEWALFDTVMTADQMDLILAWMLELAQQEMKRQGK